MTKTPAVIVLGMAGSGKTTFVGKLSSLLSEMKKTFVINLDPAVRTLPYQPNIDIRESINYKDVMRNYNLGPNGAIITCLNLFATKFNKVIESIEKNNQSIDLTIFDTPGQIEVFTWSASGSIITETVASAIPTIVIYVIDIVRSANPSTFMSNMLYALSVMYKSKLPLLVVFNKVDILKSDFAINWMNDLDSFQEKMSQESSYSSNLTSSLHLALEEFFKELKHISVSSSTGEGMSEILPLIQSMVNDYNETYLPLLKKENNGITHA